MTTSLQLARCALQSSLYNFRMILTGFYMLFAALRRVGFLHLPFDWQDIEAR
jgi:hypothetical protein